MQNQLISWQDYLGFIHPDRATMYVEYFWLVEELAGISSPEWCLLVTEDDQHLLFYETFSLEGPTLEILGSENGIHLRFDVTQKFFEEASGVAIQEYVTFWEGKKDIIPYIAPPNLTWQGSNYDDKNCAIFQSPIANLAFPSWEKYLGSLCKDYRYKCRKSRSMDYKFILEKTYSTSHLQWAINQCKNHWDEEDERKWAISQQIWAYVQTRHGANRLGAYAYKNEDLIGFTTNLIEHDHMYLETLVSTRESYVGLFLLTGMVQHLISQGEIKVYDPGIMTNIIAAQEGEVYYLYKKPITNDTTKYRLYWFGGGGPIDNEIIPPYFYKGKWTYANQA